MLPGCPTWPQEFAERYRKAGYWEEVTFGEMLRERAVSQGDRTAVTDGQTSTSYRELDEKVDRLAAGFYQLGIRSTDRVIVQLPNVTEFFDVCFALFRLGALPIFSLPAHRSSEIAYFGEFSEAVAYIIPDVYSGFDYRGLAREVQARVATLRHVIVVGKPQEFTALSGLYIQPDQSLPQVLAGDIAFLQLSGGSTGLPKLIPRTHDDYIYSLRGSVEICGLDEDSVYLAALPMAHNYPLSSPGVFGALYAGAKIVLAPTPSPDDAFPLIEQEQVTITALVPPLALVWLDSASSRTCDLSSLQVLQVGGAKFNEEAARRIKPELGCTLQQVFGMAEGLVNYTRLDDPEDIIVATQGRPISIDDEIKILDDEDKEVAPGEVGHLLTRGPYTIRGYYKADQHNARAFTRDGFYRTGDLVRLSPDGNVIVEGRAKDQINRGGEKVAAEEIENHLLAHPGVHDAAIVAMPDEYLGERSCAFIIPYEMVPTVTELKKFLRERGLAAYKIPDRIEFITAFPQTSVGKVSKKALREMITQQLASAPEPHGDITMSKNT
ncbi:MULTISPECIES: (2,3-dihydroxybenzoyl)adenylate synthase [Paenibacillus]|uniref:(2,3-dihydroxybenzoyl)adenylate synthase n=1 Tax=Paenibacillus TaxID=44249 RepID=UPI00041A3B8A|nr:MULTISPECIES: (2,3-dihydroxybenzoyl)adenylate synthase [Paenibacillus]KEO80346.1 enterobactin synthase subunit E [Paenibacillus polymyxa]MCH6186459.1 (2,3-dihydroxybenzoyl)adenylate synthase [Paenibacillus polymyxa]QGT45414.1 DhbE [Paenibacillus polymyxa]UMY57288.1 (2,3-dihydroxybenzoyl)adenylate synthase [Paenibacillus peoriae]WRL61656.1 (2,3-dihydroxybenzoyl)adenylate synthase [Paenibacillus polymyxa]